LIVPQETYVLASLNFLKKKKKTTNAIHCPALAHPLLTPN
jgi:hypothetical protein